MARRYEMTAADYESLNMRAIPFNIIIMVIAAICTMMLFLGNFWKFTIKYKIDESILKNVVGTINPKDENSQIFEDLDFSVIDDVPIGFSVSIKSDVLLTSITGGGKETSKKLISSLVTDLTGQVGGIMASVLKASAKLFVDAALENIKDQLNGLPENFVNDFDLSGVNEIIDSLFEGTTPEKLTDKIMLLIADAAKQAGLPEDDIEILVGDSSDLKNKVAESVDGMLGTLNANENGAISAEQIIARLLGEALGVNYEGMSFDDIANNIAESLVEEMPETITKIIYYGVLGFAVLLLITIAAWGLLFLFAFIRLFTRKKTVYLGFARGFGCLLYSLLVIMPWATLLILKIPAVLKLLPESVSVVLSGLSAGFSSVGLLISFIGAVALMVLKWCGYRKIKKQVKYAVITNEGFNEVSSESTDDFSYERPKFSDENEDIFSNGNFDNNNWKR